MDDLRQPATFRPLALGLAAGVFGIGLCVVFASQNPAVLWRSFLWAIIPCWLISMGASGLIAIGNLTGGRWATAARPFYLASMQTFPLKAAALIVLALGVSRIYPWAVADSVTRESLPAGKAMYLSLPFFFARGAVYLAVWTFVTRWLARVSRLDLPPGSTPEMRRAGALSLVLLAPTVTFAAFDWVMSLEPHWYSSIFGAILTAGGVVAAHAIAIRGLARTPARLRQAIITSATHEPVSEMETSAVFGDLGNLLLAFIMVWMYFSLSQFLIIWSGNLPSEIVWYDRRLAGGWLLAALAIVALYFVVPFFALLSRDSKQNIRTLAAIAAIVLLGFGINMYWTIVPAFEPLSANEHWTNVGAILASSGFALAFRAWLLGRILRTNYGGAIET